MKKMALANRESLRQIVITNPEAVVQIVHEQTPTKTLDVKIETLTVGSREEPTDSYYQRTNIHLLKPRKEKR